MGSSPFRRSTNNDRIMTPPAIIRIGPSSSITVTMFTLLCLITMTIVGIFLHDRTFLSFFSKTQGGLRYDVKPSSMDSYTGGSRSNISNVEKEPKRIQSISILGERNSGTTWMYEHLNGCFNHTIPVKRRLTRYKHWFQDDTTGSNIKDGTLVLAMFRNPFEWVEAMRKRPHHASKHLYLDWKEFVTMEWSMPRVGLDLMIDEEDRGTKVCQEDFLYRDIVSCFTRPYPKSYFKKTRYSEHQPFYEMKNDKSGKPYKNILELRSAKIKNFLSTRDYKGVNDLWVIQYEQLLKDGTAPIISEIEEATGVTAKCSPSPPQNRERRKIDLELIDYLLKHLDWEVEKELGYHKDGIFSPTVY